MSAPHSPDDEPVRITDKRRVRPDGSPVEPPAPASAPVADEQGPLPLMSEDARLLEERTADLQRLQAEYANYRRRTERDRLLAGEVAVGGVLAALLPVLDDLDRARAHGDLTGALKSVADHLEAMTGKFGLVQFGEVGDAFDPTVHEAVTHSESADVEVPTATLVLRKGYKHGERLLRPAMVGVTEPATAEPAADATLRDEPGEQDAKAD